VRTLSFPADLAPQCAPLAWLIGRWEGQGHGDYPTIEGFRFAQQVVFEHNGKPFLSYRSRSWLLDDDGEIVRPLATETGFWRPLPGIAPEQIPDARAPFALEVLLTHPTGFVEIWLGEVDGAKIELRTDLVARTAAAKEYTAGHRLYGLVDGDLMWAFDMAAVQQPIQPHLWARLARVPDENG
jgi:hypothetical protein